MTARALSGALVVALLLVACAPSAVPSPTPSADEPSSYERLFERVGPNGEVDLQLALDAFALAIAPIPGAQPIAGSPPKPHEMKSGTFAVRWIMNHYSELNAEQKAAVDSALAPGPEAVTVMPEQTGVLASLGAVGVPTGWSPPAPRPVAAVPNTHEAYVAIAKEAVTLISQRLGRPLLVPYYVWLDDENDGSNLAFTASAAFPGVGLFGCGIHVQPRLRSGYSDSDIRTTMAHEMFHCFQAAIIGHRAFWEQKEPAWIIEGGAEFAGEVIMGPSDTVGVGWWNTYITTPHRPLIGRTYDASGFFWRLQELGFDPLSRMDSMLRELFNPEEAFKAVGAAADQFLYAWASSFIRKQEWGINWDAEPIWASSTKATPTAATVVLNASVPVIAPKWTNDVYAVDTDVEIVEIRIKGFGRLHLPDGDILDLEQLWLCTNGDCRCPEGQRFTGPDFVPAFGNFHVALTGGLDGTSGTLTGHETKEFCEPESSPPPGGDPCPTGCSSSTGEPHLTTVDGVGYDFQATGEYVLLRSPDGSFELQSRQVQIPSNAEVSANAAVAMRAGDQRVAIYTEAGRVPPLEVRVDGEIVDATTPIDLAGGARVATYTGGVQVDFADGSRLWAVPIGEGCCINILLAASENLSEDGVGLLGNVTPGGARLPALPDGSRLPRPADRHEQFVQLYEQLGPAWLVTAESTLFDYEPGQSTTDFVTPGFPVEAEYRTIEDLPPDVRAQGEQLCAGVADSERFVECVFDVSIADFIAWAEGYLKLVELEETGPVAIGAPVPQPPPPPPDELPAGFIPVTDEVAWVDEAQLRDDGRLYLAVRDRNDARSVIAVDSATGAIVAESQLEHYGPLVVTSDSVWVGAAKDFDCLAKRLDPDTLGEIATVPIVCDIFKSQFAALGDDIWFLDRTTADGDARGGTLRRIDAATNQVGTAATDAVTVPFTNGRLQGSDGAIFWRADAVDESGDNQIYRLEPGGTALESLGRPDGPTFPGGRGVWVEVLAGTALEAHYRTTAAAPDAVLPIDGTLVGGDTSSAFVSSSDFDGTPILLRYPMDGAAPTVAATGVGLETSAGYVQLSYFGDRPLLVANDRVVMYWLVPSPDDPAVTNLVIQASSLP